MRGPGLGVGHWDLGGTEGKKINSIVNSFLQIPN
jgi:hypothetical protein